MKAALIFTPDRANTLEYAREAASVLRARGVTVLVEQPALAQFHGQAESVEDAVPDVVLTIGGDGTLIWGSRYAIRHDVPLLGVNLGRVGFLAEANPGDRDLITRLLDADYLVEERSILSVNHQGRTETAMNDAVLTRGGYGRPISLHVYVNDDLAGKYLADGLVLSTPTGSTGYSLSAGGPILSPDVRGILITPVCAHTLQHRPLMVPDTAEIRVETVLGVNDAGMLQLDGRNVGPLSHCDTVTVSAAGRRLKLIRLSKPHFFQLVRDKLTEWNQ